MQLLWPESPAHALALRAAHPGARFVAGGTALQQEWGDRHRAPAGCCLVPLHRLSALHGIERVAGAGASALRIGAATPLETVRTHALVREHAPLLAQALSQLGALGVRHLGTLGGNVGWRWGDSTPALLVLDAQAECAHAPGQSLSLAALLAQAELPLIVALHIPLGPDHAPLHTVFEKAAVRAAFAPARLRLALRWSDGRLSHAACAAPGLPARRLMHTFSWLRAHPELCGAAALAGLRQACAEDGLPTEHPEDLAHLAARLIAGHCGLLSSVPKEVQ